MLNLGFTLTNTQGTDKRYLLVLVFGCKISVALQGHQFPFFRKKNQFYGCCGR
ncbi:hypothetical protein CLV24_12721 [Pontibacter ummariensis]|uniref:Uncharacterized protein n=1 Tax=Pontibacter ummariensis TaxID=1610492 RepID=A0A239KE44_9BACT|nr:hypothetical protein CLV24_12721 [Pontibacter ummariensis]SNT16627.1 hypothetical protein SAMN06296052_12821 [Pontibacter ummariensis]